MIAILETALHKVSNAGALASLKQCYLLNHTLLDLTIFFSHPSFSPTVHVAGWIYVLWMHQHEILQMVTGLNICEAVITVF